MIRILLLILGSLLTAAAYLLGSPGLLAAGIAVLLPSLLWLALRRGFGLAVLLAIILAMGLGGALILGSESPSSPLVLGLPRRAALLVYGIGLLPGVIFGILFALGFDKLVISSERLTELRDRLKER